MEGWRDGGMEGHIVHPSIRGMDKWKNGWRDRETGAWMVGLIDG